MVTGAVTFFALVVEVVGGGACLLPVEELEKDESSSKVSRIEGFFDPIPALAVVVAVGGGAVTTTGGAAGGGDGALDLTGVEELESFCRCCFNASCLALRRSL